ncbi:MULTISPECIES: preprotein translocase subunit YajC [Motilimonas]|uniref:Sec translocon accessory complex subunit YajC n=1 Tax=Motilimonas cestriensis TaxID=2742685 RepID=A0ABS8W8Y6_9GAMM|nr:MULTISPECIES: preprotein translocase subunit YajC [Motilimonas]MCE0558115.1 preprotein translocase subunit YajC [Motilimonas sp. E26]MCE2594567.1 preprotein translocase subunit YajC [Motilimonas cestriensis]MDO6524474.1 preprotein translocase subunit YajC [Motilimonas sp. 1_MG-2023]
MSFLISNAYAAPAAGAEGGGMSMIFMLVVFAAIFYFMIFRPQNKRVKEHKNLMSSLSKGDEVLTQGGLVGRIVKVSDENDYITIELNENNQVVIKRDFVSAILPKGTLKSL